MNKNISQYFLVIESVLILALCVPSIAELVADLNNTIEYVRLGIALIGSIVGGIFIKKLNQKYAMKAFKGTRFAILLVLLGVNLLELINQDIILSMEILITLALLQIYLDSFISMNLITEANLNQPDAVVLSSNSRLLMIIIFGCFLPYMGTMSYLKRPFIFAFLLLCLICIEVIHMIYQKSPEKSSFGDKNSDEPPKILVNSLKIKERAIPFFRKLVLTLLMLIFFVGCIYLAWDPRRLSFPFLSYVLYYDQFVIASYLFYAFIGGWGVVQFMIIKYPNSKKRNLVVGFVILGFLLTGFLIQIPESFLIPWSLVILANLSGLFTLITQKLI